MILSLKRHVDYKSYWRNAKYGKFSNWLWVGVNFNFLKTLHYLTVCYFVHRRLCRAIIYHILYSIIQECDRILNLYYMLCCTICKILHNDYDILPYSTYGNFFFQTDWKFPCERWWNSKWLYKGCIQGEYSIQIKPEVTPVVHTARKVPVALKEKVQEELNRMKKLNIITKVDEPTEWVNSMVGGAETQWDSKNIPGSNRPKRGD